MNGIIRVTLYGLGLCLFWITKSKLVAPAALFTIWWFTESLKAFQLLEHETLKGKCIGILMGPFVWAHALAGKAEYEVVLNDVVIAKTNKADLAEIRRTNAMSIRILIAEQIILLFKEIVISLRSLLSTIGGTLFALMLIMYKIDKNYTLDFIENVSNSFTSAETERYFFVAVTAILTTALYRLPNVSKSKFENELLKRLREPCRGILQIKLC